MTADIPTDQMSPPVTSELSAQHQRMLEQRTGQLADYGYYVRSDINELGRAITHLSLEPQQIEQERLLESDRVKQQTELLGQYFSRASEALESGATEEKVWDKVFETQLEHLQFGFEPGQQKGRQELALNILVGNLLAAYDKTPEESGNYA